MKKWGGVGAGMCCGQGKLKEKAHGIELLICKMMMEMEQWSQ